MAIAGSHKSERVVMVPFTCPNCICTVSSISSRVKRHGWKDYFYWLFGMYPWYCTACGVRFYKRQRTLT